MCAMGRSTEALGVRSYEQSDFLETDLVPDSTALFTELTEQDFFPSWSIIQDLSTISDVAVPLRASDEMLLLALGRDGASTFSSRLRAAIAPLLPPEPLMPTGGAPPLQHLGPHRSLARAHALGRPPTDPERRDQAGDGIARKAGGGVPMHGVGRSDVTIPPQAVLLQLEHAIGAVSRRRLGHRERSSVPASDRMSPTDALRP